MVETDEGFHLEKALETKTNNNHFPVLVFVSPGNNDRGAPKGTAEVSPTDALDIFSGSFGAGDPATLILLRVRLPRIILAGLVGFSLSLGRAP